MEISSVQQLASNFRQRDCRARLISHLPSTWTLAAHGRGVVRESLFVCLFICLFKVGSSTDKTVYLKRSYAKGKKKEK